MSAIAMHEAAHVVAAYLTGLPIVAVRVRPRPAMMTPGAWRHALRDRVYTAAMLTAAAGGAQTGRESASDAEAMTYAARMLGVLPCQRARVFARARRRVAEMLADRPARRAVKALAKVLDERGELTGAEAGRVIAAALAG